MIKSSENPLLDPVHLSRIDDLFLLAKVVVEGNFFGLHRSRRQGQGNEFFQYRSYEAGEDLKNVDWKVYGKLGELVSKSYQESANANLFIVLDGSASMSYQGEGSPCSKFRYAQMLAACMAYLAQRQGDRIGLFGGSEDSMQWMFPSGGKESFKSLLACIGGMSPSGLDVGDPAWDKFKSKLPMHATVVVISDFLENEAKLRDRLSFARSPRYECICLQVLDPLEEKLPDAEAVRFVELEGQGEVSVSPDRIRGDYQLSMSNHLEKLSGIFAGTGSEFSTLRTHDDLGHGIRKFLGMRGMNK
ncbi:DUF58 domain-containing protein [Candidatus Chordibacter forsetii]|mgnify:FL=1|uniref:DUF58 domain-containing protein n=1 Tax=Candidatus Chordibacter forsetii TaxID=3381758 RepID=UPI00231C6114|nr:DUF58 domain-containing protein [Opitutales bacterium]MDA8989299.1 DUF58 domain-containing protein [Opitutales bacterium]